MTQCNSSTSKGRSTIALEEANKTVRDTQGYGLIEYTNRLMATPGVHHHVSLPAARLERSGAFHDQTVRSGG